MNQHCCQCNGDACGPGDHPFCLDLTLSGIATLESCEFTCGLDELRTATAMGIGLNGTFRVYLPGGGEGYFSASIPVYAIVRDYGACDLDTVRTATELYIEVFSGCVDGRTQVGEIIAELVFYDHGAPGSGFLLRERVFEWSGGPVASGVAVENDLDTVCDPSTPFYFPFGGGNASFSVPGSCPAPPNPIYQARHCPGTLPPISVDISTIPDNTIVESCELDGESYYLTDDPSNDSAVAVTWSADACPLTPLAQRCDDPSEVVGFDPSTRPIDGVTFDYAGERWVPNGDEADVATVAAVWTDEPCPESPLRIARRCIGSGEITYDPATQPDGALTMFHEAVRYYPTTISSPGPAVEVTWSFSGCVTPGPNPSDPCADDACSAKSPNFPACCSRPEFGLCQQCGLFLQAPEGFGDEGGGDGGEPATAGAGMGGVKVKAGRRGKSAKKAGPGCQDEVLWSKARMLAAYTQAKLSGRGADEATVAKRLESCRACPSYCSDGSKTWCGACGCGSNRPEALITGGDRPSKLEFVKLSCPRRRPGFSNEEVGE